MLRSTYRNSRMIVDIPGVNTALFIFVEFYRNNRHGTHVQFCIIYIKGVRCECGDVDVSSESKIYPEIDYSLEVSDTFPRLS